MATVDLSTPVDMSGTDRLEMPRYHDPDTEHCKRSSTVSTVTIERAKNVVSTNISKLNSLMRANPRMIQLCAGGGGCTLMILCVVSLLQGLQTWSPMSCLVNIYLLIFAMATVLVEMEHSSFDRVRDLVFLEAHFLATEKGIALFYVFQGSLAVMQEEKGGGAFSILNMLYTIIGILYIVLGIFHGTRSFTTPSPQESGFTEELQFRT